MKKWKKQALTLGVASALIVPSFAAGADASYKTTYNKNSKSAVDLSKFEVNKEYYSKDTLVINYSKKLTAADHRRAGTSLVKSYPNLGYDVVKLNKGSKLSKALQAYKANGQVVSVAPSVIIKPFKTAADPKTNEMYHLKQMNIDKALKLAGNKEVVVAVIDTWVDSDHPELKSRMLPAYNVANPAKPGTKESHGTHVSGIIAGDQDNGLGGYGINPNAKILPINVFDGFNSGSDYVIAEAILYAVDHGAKVINMSLGGYGESKIMEAAVKKAIDKGVTIVAAAGNEETDMYSVPASYDGVISVGATNDKKELAGFSNFGPSVNIVAPGENVYSTTHYISTNQSSFTEMSGTSMASPVVAGVASLILAKYPDLKPYQVRTLLERTASDLGEKGYDLKYAHGLVNPVAALSYDISKLPKQEKLTEKERLQAAEEAVLEEGKLSLKGKLTKPVEEKLYKINLTKGVPVQLILKGAKEFDYKAALHFYPEGKDRSELPPVEINDAKAGGTEGYVYTPKESGTLVVAVTDYNGAYNEAGRSQYELTLIQKEVKKNESTKEAPITIKELPFKQEGYFYSPEGEAKDYYSFSVAEPTTFDLKLSAVPGVDPSLSVYFKDDLLMEVPEDLSAEEAMMYIPSPIASADRNGASQGEALTFEAIPDMEYVIEVSSTGSNGYFDPFMFFMEGIDFERANTNSLVPYSFTMNEVVLPEDEDLYPEELTDEELLVEEEITIEEYKAKKRQLLEDVIDEEPEEPGEPIEEPEEPIEEPGDESDEEFTGYRYFPEEITTQIVEAARPLELNKTANGYFQFEADEDWFSITAEEAALYKITTNKTDTLRPNFELFEYSEKFNNLEPIAWGGANYSMYGEGTDPEMFATLKAGKQYFVKLDNGYTASAEQYDIKVAKVADIPAADFEGNNNYEKAAELTIDQKVTGNFALLNERQVFYFKNNDKDRYIHVKASPNPVSFNDKLRLPKEVTQEIFPVLIVHEDSNGNGKLDLAEQNKAIAYLRYEELLDSVNAINKPVKATFKAKEQIGYFIEVQDFIGNPINFTTYDLEVNAMKHVKDEDAASVVKNNIPSKPLALKKDGKASSASGYLNIGVLGGDEDYYKFTAPKAGSYEFSLDVPFDLDGVVSIYTSKGALVKELNYYGLGDKELSTLNLEKGDYYIQVKDADSRSSDEAYKLTVKQK
ncbi:S8 family serine peptidase [Cytobacillus massiliigabonensis]|uniref:S8 family serine peptidase n=1 Tax=Cytobacillus massiliigabonensis TaxID=1871011 RepID=UPI000C862A0B|nr:S8 family serine peptidase [Cytobacillus massiliigabonensis]